MSDPAELFRIFYLPSFFLVLILLPIKGILAEDREPTFEEWFIRFFEEIFKNLVVASIPLYNLVVVIYLLIVVIFKTASAIVRNTY